MSASDPTISEEEGAPPVVEVETGTTMGVGTAARGRDEGRHHEGRVEEMGEDEWIDGGGETHHWEAKTTHFLGHKLNPISSHFWDGGIFSMMFLLVAR